MYAQEEKAKHLKEAIREKEIRRRMPEIKDLDKKEHVAKIIDEMTKKKPDPGTIAAHAKACKLGEIDPTLAGQVRKYTEPDENTKRLAKEISPVKLAQYKGEEQDKDSKISNELAELKAAKRVVGESYQATIDYKQRQIDDDAGNRLQLPVPGPHRRVANLAVIPDAFANQPVGKGFHHALIVSPPPPLGNRFFPPSPKQKYR